MPVDASNLQGLLGSVGKTLAAQPGARALVAQVRDARDPGELSRILAPLDLGLDPPARAVVTDALEDHARWKGLHATLVRSAEQSLEERYHPGA